MKRFWARTALIAGGLALGVLIAEIFLRVVGFSEPQIYVPDRLIGTRLMPGFEGVWTREGHAEFEINSAGFRDRERPIEKSAGTYRIAVLGDSYVEALQVPREKSLPAVLEAELAECPSVERGEIEVLSFGVSGFGTGQQLLLLRHVVWDYEPDLVVLMMCPHNDVQDNSRKLTNSVVRPFFSLENDELVLDGAFRRHPSYLYAKRPSTRWKVDLINHSRLLQLYCRFRNRPKEPPEPDRDAADPNDLDNLCYVEPARPSWREAWAVTERLIRQMAKEVKAQNARFLLVVGTTGMQVDPRQSVRKEFREKLGVTDLFYFERRIRELAHREEIPMLGLGKPMAEFAKRRQTFLHGFPNTPLGQGHWNADGHRLAAELVAKAVCQNFFGRKVLSRASQHIE